MIKIKFTQNSRRFFICIGLILCFSCCKSQTIESKEIKDLELVNKDLLIILDTLITSGSVDDPTTTYIINSYIKNSVVELRISYAEEYILKAHFKEKLKSVYGISYFNNKKVLVFGISNDSLFKEIGFSKLPLSLTSEIKPKSVNILPIFDPEVRLYSFTSNEFKLERIGNFAIWED